MNAPIVKVKNQRSNSAQSPKEVRIAYPWLHEKRTKNAAGLLYVNKATGVANPRFSAGLMFPKLNADPYQCANYMFLWGLAVEAAQKMWPQNVDQAGKWVWPQGAQYAVKDGDVPYTSKPKPGQPVQSAEEIAKKNAWRVGYWHVETENFLDPGPGIAKLINGQIFELPARKCTLLGGAMVGDPAKGVDQYKSGDWGFPQIHAWAYQNETFGVNFGIDGFCFTREDELIGSQSGPKSASQMFGNLGTVAPSGVAPGAAPLPPGAGVVRAPVMGVPNAAGPAAPPALPGLPGATPVAPPALPGLPPIPGR